MDYTAKVRDLVRSYRDDMVRDLFRLVAVESVLGEAQEGMPFGPGPAKALELACEIGRENGFETKNLDGYCAWAEMGEGDERIGMIGHVDVVPLGEGWTHPPLGSDIQNGRLYGRGVCDNKGGCIMGLYAMKAVRELGIDVNKKVRMVFGANEETGMADMDYYEAKEGPFDYAFTPDAQFPVTFGEKGNYDAVFSAPLKGGENSKIDIISISGGQAVNVVPPSCEAIVDARGHDGAVAYQFDRYLSGRGLTGTAIAEERGLLLRLEGKAAHASLPHLGINSISHMINFLSSLVVDSPFIDGYKKVIGLCHYGENCGVDKSDKYGRLTMNIGIIETDGDRAKATIDIRYPVTIDDFKPYAKRLNDSFNEAGLTIDTQNIGPSLFIDPDSPLVKTLSEVYAEVTGDTEHVPVTMGGGTYAKHLKNCVAFGCEFPGDDNNLHNADEFLSEEKMLLATEVLVHALIKLLSL